MPSCHREPERCREQAGPADWGTAGERGAEEALDIEAVTVREAGGAGVSGVETKAQPQAAAAWSQATEAPTVPAATAPENPSARRPATSSRAAAVPELLRHSEDDATLQESQNSTDSRVESVHGGSAEPSDEVIDAEIVDARGAVPEPAAAAEHQAGLQAGGQEVLSLHASETSATRSQSI